MDDLHKLCNVVNDLLVPTSFGHMAALRYCSFGVSWKAILLASDTNKYLVGRWLGLMDLPSSSVLSKLHFLQTTLWTLRAKTAAWFQAT